METRGKASRMIVYFDQVVENENKQDSMTVANMVEVSIFDLKEQLSSFETAVLQSGNASCYQ